MEKLSNIEAELKKSVAYKVKKKRLFPVLLFPILYSMSDKKPLLKEYFLKNSHKTQSKWSIANYSRRRVLAGSV